MRELDMYGRETGMVLTEAGLIIDDYKMIERDESVSWSVNREVQAWKNGELKLEDCCMIAQFLRTPTCSPIMQGTIWFEHKDTFFDILEAL